MALGGLTLTVTINAIAKVLKRINQDNYSTQYYLREPTEEFTVNIRHSKEAIQKDGTQFDRHNIELINTVFPTETMPGKSRVQYIVIRNLRNDDYTAVKNDILGLTGVITGAGNIDDILSWVS